MNKQCTRYFSNKQEKHVAKAVGGKQTANSGATSALHSIRYHI